MAPLLALLGLCTAWSGVALALLTWRDPAGARDGWEVAVVCGAAVRPDGTASGALERRTRHAVALWRSGAVQRVCFTGGVGRHGPAESVVAADLARSLGVPDEAIAVEALSTNTEENAREAARVLGPARVLVVTDSYHGWRCRRVFLRYFPAVGVVTSHPPTPMAARMAMRESVVLAWYAVSGRLRAR